MARTVVDIARRTRDAAERLRFSAPVTHVYNPLVYAWEPHRQYLERYARGRREVLFLGMNPGPWGMVQTGVPFGDVEMVRDWLGIRANVGRPGRQNKNRPVSGFDCRRREISGRRLWGWARDRFGSPSEFQLRFVVLNYCPLAFLEESGRNRTPDRLPPAEREELFGICDEALRDTVRLLRPEFVVGLGRFAEGRARQALAKAGVAVGGAPHPSPANPQANDGWALRMDAALQQIGIPLL